MSEQPLDLLEQALKLDPGQRALLAAELVASLDAEEDSAERHRAWLAEIERRVRRARSGGLHGADWDSVEQRIRARLSARGA